MAKKEKTTKKRVTIKTPVYEEGSNKRLAVNKMTLVSKGGKIIKERSVSKGGGKVTVKKQNNNKGTSSSKTRKTIGSSVRGAAQKAGVGQKRGQVSMSVPAVRDGKNSLRSRKTALTRKKK